MRTAQRGAPFLAATFVGLALAASSSPAWAIGEDQVDRIFVSFGPGLLVPVSNDFQDTYDTSFGFVLEGGFIASLGTSGFAIAPTATFKYWSLDDDVGTVAFQSWAWQINAALKAGWAGRGLFVYAEAGLGLNTVQWELCVFLGCSRDNETDFMLRFGGGADFSVWKFIAVGASLGFPIVFSDSGGRYTEDTIGYEMHIYAKALFPEGRLR